MSETFGCIWRVNVTVANAYEEKRRGVNSIIFRGGNRLEIKA
jgi:hypothetical protein